MTADEHTLNLEGHHPRNPFWRELDEGLITFRDVLQFELKSEFFINPSIPKNVYKQEFYIFIPETLQINAHTYTMKDFYLDQTNLIRYKTPYLTLEELVDSSNRKSPLSRIHTYQNKDQILRELMLFGNIFRSTVRLRIRRLIKELAKAETECPTVSIPDQVQILCGDIENVRNEFEKLRDFLHDRFEPNHFDKQVDYVDEFMSEVINEYLTLFLDLMRKNYPQDTPDADHALCELLEKERRHRVQSKYGPKDSSPESILYREGLLEKFMINVLKLRNTRVLLRERHAQFIASIAAGTAMLVYMVLFVWQASTLVITSAPFVFFVVFFYIIKDRLKEGLKTYYHRKAALWFPDYSTEIQSPTGETIGKLNESFSFIPFNAIPEGFRELRYKDDLDELDAYQPIETIMLYKKEMLLYKHKGRLNEVNTIFRYNIHRFLEKANDAVLPTLTLDPVTRDLAQELLPKVYHINIILKTAYQDEKLRACIQIKKFRVIIDKAGIRRVEHISSHFEREEADKAEI